MTRWPRQQNDRQYSSEYDAITNQEDGPNPEPLALFMDLQNQL